MHFFLWFISDIYGCYAYGITIKKYLGDGMGIPTITAGRILKGQMQGNSGEETVLAMDQFSHVGLSKVRKLLPNIQNFHSRMFFLDRRCGYHLF